MGRPNWSLCQSIKTKTFYSDKTQIELYDTHAKALCSEKAAVHITLYRTDIVVAV